MKNVLICKVHAPKLTFTPFSNHAIEHPKLKPHFFGGKMAKLNVHEAANTITCPIQPQHNIQQQNNFRMNKDETLKPKVIKLNNTKIHARPSM